MDTTQKKKTKEVIKFIQRYEETTLQTVERICRDFCCNAEFCADSRTVRYTPAVQIVKEG